MSIALVITDRNTDSLVLALQNKLPDLTIQVWPNIESPESVTFAVLWKHPKGLLKSLPNLKAVTSLGAGIDFIQSDPDLPKNLSVYRIVTDHLKQQMAQYVLSFILPDFRQLEHYKKQQQKSLWKSNELPKKTTVGFLGLGTIGEFVAQQCCNLGFNVIAHTQNSKHKTIACFHSQYGLKKVLSKSDYLVCLLPLTPDTKNILNLNTLSFCNKSPLLIHVGRGEQLVEKDLLSALEKGLIRQAVIDVFEIEPLSKNHGFWKRKDICITPHNAARSDVDQTAIEVANLYKDL